MAPNRIRPRRVTPVIRTLLKNACPSAALFQASAKFDQTNCVGHPKGLFSRSVGDLSATDNNTMSGMTTTALQNSTISNARPLEASNPGVKGVADFLRKRRVCILEFHLSFAQETQIEYRQAENEHRHDNAYRRPVSKMVQGKGLFVEAYGKRFAGICGSTVGHHKNQIKDFQAANHGKNDVYGHGRS